MSAPVIALETVPPPSELRPEASTAATTRTAANPTVLGRTPEVRKVYSMVRPVAATPTTRDTLLSPATPMSNRLARIMSRTTP